MNLTGKAFLIFAIGGVCSGCTTTSGVVPMGQDTFVIARTEKGFKGTSANVKVEALREANQYCQSRGKVMKVIARPALKCRYQS